MILSILKNAYCLQQKKKKRKKRVMELRAGPTYQWNYRIKPESRGEGPILNFTIRCMHAFLTDML